MSRASLSGLAASLALGLVCGGCVGSGDVMVPLPLAPIAAMAYEAHKEREVASFGAPLKYDPRPDPLYSTAWSPSFRYPVSDHFGTNDLHHLYEALNSAEFRDSLTNFNCGDPVPKFSCAVWLIRYPDRKTDFLAVQWASNLTTEVRDLGLRDGQIYAVEKVLAGIAAARTTNCPWFRVLYKPYVDCSRRPAPGQKLSGSLGPGDPENWVTYPGPPEVQY